MVGGGGGSVNAVLVNKPDHLTSDPLFIAHLSVKLPVSSNHNTRYKILDMLTQEVRGAESLDVQVHEPWAYMYSMGAMNIH